MGKAKKRQSLTRQARASEDKSFTANIVLPARLVIFLDEVALSILKKTGASLNRSKLIRGFIDAMRQANLDLSENTSEKEISNFVARKLSRQ